MSVLLLRRASRALLPMCAVGALLVPAAALADTQPLANPGPMVTGWNGNIGDVLSCEPLFWSDDNLTFTHVWNRDGAAFASGGTYTVTIADAMHSLSCTQTATNGAGSATAESQTFGVADVAAAVVTTPHVSGTPTVGQTLSCDGASFSGTNLTPVTYRWSREGTNLGTSQTYTLAPADADGQVRCHVGVRNGSANVEADSQDVNVASGGPQRITSPKITGSGRPGAKLTCSPGTWSGDGITYRYQWLRGEKAVAGATRPTLVLTDADVDKVFTCRVTATNALGSESRTSNGIVGFAPGVLAPLAKVQPRLPKLGVALAKGVTGKVVCNVTCATESHAFILASLGSRLGIKGRVLGGEMIIGTGRAHRTLGGDLLVTTTFSPQVRRALATQRSVTINMLYETSGGTVYNYRKYHVAESNTIVLRR